MRILLTGASGLVGSAVTEAAHRRGHEIIAVYHSLKPEIPDPGSVIKADLSNDNETTRIVLEVFPDVIVNAAAISSPAAAKANPELSEKLNINMPSRLAECASHLSAKLIHLSSDLVFNGQRGNYCSTDMPSPLSLYGEHKRQAEERVLENGGNHATILRITLQNGNSPRDNRSPHERMFEAFSNGEKPAFFTDEIRQPTNAENTADAIVEICERNDLHGIFHWAGSEAVSRYDIASAILKRFALPNDLIKPCLAKDMPGSEERPLNLTFDLHPLAGKLKTQPETLERQLENLVVPLPYRKWYHSL